MMPSSQECTTWRKHDKLFLKSGVGEAQVHICKIGQGLDAQLPENKKKIYRQENQKNQTK